MKLKLIILFSILASLLIGLLAGFSISTYKDRENVAYALLRYNQFYEFQKQDHISNLESIYRYIESDPEIAQRFIKMLIAIDYEKNEDVNNLFSTKPTTSIFYETNLRIEEFLSEHPFEACIGVPEADLLECNLNNIYPE